MVRSKPNLPKLIANIAFIIGTISSSNQHLTKQELLDLRQDIEERILYNLAESIPKVFNDDNSLQSSGHHSSINYASIDYSNEGYLDYSKTKSAVNLDDSESPVKKKRWIVDSEENIQNQKQAVVSPSLFQSLYEDDTSESVEHILIKTVCQKTSSDSSVCKLDQFGYLKVVETKGFKRCQQVLMKIEYINTTSKLAVITYVNKHGDKKIKKTNIYWSSKTIADLVIPVEIFEEGSEIEVKFDDINEGFDETQALTRVTFVKENLLNDNSGNELIHSRRRRNARRGCDPNKGCCRVKLGRLKKYELENMAIGLFGEEYRRSINVVAKDIDIYTCYSKVAKCNLPTFTSKNIDYYDNHEKFMGRLWHSKHSKAGYSGCCQADGWERMKVAIVDSSNNNPKYLLNSELVINPTTCSCGVKASTPGRRRRRSTNS